MLQNIIYLNVKAVLVHLPVSAPTCELTCECWFVSKNAPVCAAVMLLVVQEVHDKRVENTDLSLKAGEQRIAHSRWMYFFFD